MASTGDAELPLAVVDTNKVSNFIRLFLICIPINFQVAMPEKGGEAHSLSAVDSNKVLYSIKVILIKHINIQATKSDQPTTSAAEIKCSGSADEIKSTKSTDAKSEQPSTCSVEIKATKSGNGDGVSDQDSTSKAMIKNTQSSDDMSNQHSTSLAKIKSTQFEDDMHDQHSSTKDRIKANKSDSQSQLAKEIKKIKKIKEMEEIKVIYMSASKLLSKIKFYSVCFIIFIKCCHIYLIDWILFD